MTGSPRWSLRNRPCSEGQDRLGFYVNKQWLLHNHLQSTVRCQVRSNNELFRSIIWSEYECEGCFVLQSVRHWQKWHSVWSVPTRRRVQHLSAQHARPASPSRRTTPSVSVSTRSLLTSMFLFTFKSGYSAVPWFCLHIALHRSKYCCWKCSITL